MNKRHSGVNRNLQTSTMKTDQIQASTPVDMISKQSYDFDMTEVCLNTHLCLKIVSRGGCFN